MWASLAAFFSIYTERKKEGPPVSAVPIVKNALEKAIAAVTRIIAEIEENPIQAAQASACAACIFLYPVTPAEGKRC